MKATVDTQDKIVKAFQSKFGAWVGNVTKVSAPWTREAERYLRQKDFIVIGDIWKDRYVVGLIDGIVVELYRG